MPETPATEILKTDLFGQIRKETTTSNGQSQTVIIRDISYARTWLRPIARHLATREAKVLARLPVSPALPALINWDKTRLIRTYVAGLPMQSVKPKDASFFSSARQVLHQLHLAQIAHNDTAKEPNWLVLPDGSAGLIDFQLATIHKSRTRLFRSLALEDIRHLLKHKRSYRSSHLTKRERQILATPALYNRVWRATGKKLYVFITRRILKWQDREGANDRTL